MARRLSARFDSFTNDQREMEACGDIIVKEIKANTRKGISWDGSKFKGLDDSTIDRREALAGVNPTSEFYKPSKANATFMGETVDSIIAEVNSQKIVLSGDGKHSKMKGVKGKYLKGSDASFGDILSGLKDLGYKILGISKRAREHIATRFIRYIRREK